MATVKQKLAVKKITENHGNVSRGMLEAGYSKNTAKKPSNLTNSKGWEELMEKHLPDSLLAKVHKEGLKATKHQGVGGMAMGFEKGKMKDFGHTEIEVADYAVRHKYLESAYKIKGKLVEKIDVTSQGEKIEGFTFVTNETDNKTNNQTGTSVELPAGQPN